MTTFADQDQELREARRHQLREGLALFGSLGVTGVALFVLPTLTTFAFAWAAPNQVARIGGWVTLAAIGLVFLGFPVLHVAAHRVLVGELPSWTRSPGRWLRLALFTLWTGVPLFWVLSSPLTRDPGIASLVWGLGILVFPLLTARRNASSLNRP